MKGKIGIVFNFGRLQETINRILEPGSAAISYNGIQCCQIFSVNYGLVEYVEWENHQENIERLPNPIKYTYIKDKKYSDDKELRVSLSALGIGQFVLKDGSMMQFPNSLHLAFNFKRAIAEQTIQQILYATNCDFDFLQKELEKLRIVAIKR